MSVKEKRQIPLSYPTLGQKETDYLMDCVDTKWISSAGKYVGLFEQAFSRVAGTKHAITCSSGTAALHLALLGLELKPDDEVLIPALTFAACANAVVYCGGKPVFVDIDPAIWCIDADAIESHITSRTRGIIAVHLRGHPADMDTIMTVARSHGLFVIEDAAQAHGAQMRGKPVGSIGHAGTFSFFANKMLTTGEGGMVTTNDDAVADRIRLLKNHGMTPEKRYWHQVVGYNYRLTNLQAAIGLAQVERLTEQLARYRQVAAWYRQELAGIPGLSWQQEHDWALHAWWQFVAVIDETFAPDRDAVLERLQACGIDARRIYYPLTQLPIYDSKSTAGRYPAADWIASRAICLPTWAGLTHQDVRFVCRSLLDAAAVEPSADPKC
jgi:perosamine synthetase